MDTKKWTDEQMDGLPHHFTAGGIKRDITEEHQREPDLSLAIPSIISIFKII